MDSGCSLCSYKTDHPATPDWEVYGRAYHYFHAKQDVNPEEGHYMERLWLTIFGVTGQVEQASRESPLHKALDANATGDGVIVQDDEKE